MKNNKLYQMKNPNSQDEASQSLVPDLSEYDVLEQILDDLDDAQVSLLIDMVDLDEY